MQKLKLYMDNCCFNRPFDDQSQLIVRLETEAVLFIQEKIKSGEIELVWSYMLDLENSVNPHIEKRDSIQTWDSFAANSIIVSEPLLLIAEGFAKTGTKPKDALHLACAVLASADYFITTDKKLLKKRINELEMTSPIDFVRLFGEVENDE